MLDLYDDHTQPTIKSTIETPKHYMKSANNKDTKDLQIFKFLHQISWQAICVAAQLSRR